VTPIAPDLDSPVGQIARPDFVRLFTDETVSQALERLRHERLGERIIYFYVTDSTQRLVGVVPTRRLLLADTSMRVGDLMLGDVTSVAESTPLREAIETLTGRKLLALPVVDSERRLRGVFDIGQYTEQAVDLERREEADRLFQLAGVHVEQQEHASVWHSFRLRFPWLLANIGSGLMAALISGVFNDVLAAVVALAFFVPVVLAVAESVAIQSLTLSLQALQWDLPARKQGAGRQLAVGSLIGLGAGTLVGAAGLIWLRLPGLALVLVGGLIVGASAGATLGYIMPRIVHAWNLDPKIASGPASLALADIVALTAYLALATVVLL
jgi:magnesium transporter